MGLKSYIRDILSSDNPASSRRLITLLVAMHFITASFAILFFAFYSILWTQKGTVNLELLGTLKIILQYDFYVILSGLGFITSTDVLKLIIK